MSAPGDTRNRIDGPQAFAAAFSVSPETIDQMITYEALLRQWQKAVNLVSPGTLDAIWHRHFADSAQLVDLVPGPQTWVDLGSGAGFPALVVALMLADRPAPSPRLRGEGSGRPRVTLIESNARKCAFLAEVVRRTGISQRIAVEILSTRIELAATQARLHGADVVSARALAPLGRLLNLAAPLFTSSTVGVFLKGREAGAELDAAEKMWNFNAELVPSRTSREARVILIRNLEPKPKPNTKD